MKFQTLIPYLNISKVITGRHVTQAFEELYPGKSHELVKNNY